MPCRNLLFFIVKQRFVGNPARLVAPSHRRKDINQIIAATMSANSKRRKNAFVLVASGVIGVLSSPAFVRSLAAPVAPGPEG